MDIAARLREIGSEQYTPAFRDNGIDAPWLRSTGRRAEGLGSRPPRSDRVALRQTSPTYSSTPWCKTPHTAHSCAAGGSSCASPIGSVLEEQFPMSVRSAPNSWITWTLPEPFGQQQSERRRCSESY